MKKERKKKKILKAIIQIAKKNHAVDYKEGVANFLKNTKKTPVPRGGKKG